MKLSCHRVRNNFRCPHLAWGRGVGRDTGQEDVEGSPTQSHVLPSVQCMPRLTCGVGQREALFAPLKKAEKLKPSCNHVRSTGVPHS